MLSVANQKTLDAILRMSEAVGIQIATIEPSLIALSRAQALIGAATEEACLVIELNDGRAEIGICHKGRLLLDYRPGGHTNATNVANVIAQHLTRVQRYLDRHHGYLKSPIRTGLPGRRCRRRRSVQKQFARFKQFLTAPLNPSQLVATWRHAGQSPGPELAPLSVPHCSTIKPTPASARRI